MITDIAFQGYIGAYSQEAINLFAKKSKINLRPISQPSFNDLFSYVTKKSGLGMVPIENSTTGSVVPSYDWLSQYGKKVTIIGEVILPISHCLLANHSDLKKVKKVTSHPQALSQCQVWLEKNRLSIISGIDTAGSAKALSENPDETMACIASGLAGKIYGLKVVATNIQTKNNNQTRFLVIKNNNQKFAWEKNLKPANKTSIVFSGKNVPASLYKCLGGFATNGVDLLKLETRPHPDKPWEYLSFLDFTGSVKENSVQQALLELKFFTDQMSVLGSYSAWK